MHLGGVVPGAHEEAVAESEGRQTILELPGILVGRIASVPLGKDFRKSVAIEHEVTTEDLHGQLRVLLHHDVEQTIVTRHAAGVAHDHDALERPRGIGDVVDLVGVQARIAVPVEGVVAVSPTDHRLQRHGVSDAQLSIPSVDHERFRLIEDVEFEVAREASSIAGGEVEDFHDHRLGALGNPVFEGVERKLLHGHERREVDGVRQLGEVHPIGGRAGRVVDDDHLLDVDDGFDRTRERQDRLTAILEDDRVVGHEVCPHVDVEVDLHHGVGLEGSRLEHHDGLEGRVRTVGNGQSDVVRLSALHFALRRELDGVAILAEDVIGRVVDVVGRVGHIVDRADRDGQLRVGIRDLGEVDGIVGVRTVDAWAAQEEAEDVIVLAVDPRQVFIGTEHVVEANGVPGRHEVEFDGTDIVDAAHIEVLSNEGRHAVGDGQQVGIAGDFEVVIDEVVDASIVHIGWVVGDLRTQDQARFNGKFRGVKSGDVPDLHRAAREDDVGRLDAGAEQDVVHIFIRSEGAVHLHLRRRQETDTGKHGDGNGSEERISVHGQGHGDASYRE